MTIKVFVPLPLSEAQPVKELICMCLEQKQIAGAKVIEVTDDGYGKQASLFDAGKGGE